MPSETACVVWTRLTLREKEETGAFENFMANDEVRTASSEDDDCLEAQLLGAKQEIEALRQALANQREQFRAEMRKRTAALHNARLEAEASSAAKSDFLATMSHEIRTPIYGIMGTLDLLSETKLEPAQEDYLGTARGSAESLLRIINDILDFSKIEAGKLDIEPTTVEIRALVEDVVSSLAPLAFEKGVEAVCDVYPDVPDRVLLDPMRIRQVLTNLYGNAVKFTQRGQVVVSVQVQPDSTGQEILRIDVMDSGIGIDKERQKSLFKPFVQADSSISRKFGGTGLGLAISLRLTLLMDGKIRLKSVPRKGSRFSLRLPLESPPTPNFPANSPMEGKMLVIDDNRAAREALQRMLVSFGLEVESAGSADEALRMLKTAAGSDAPYQAVIADANMSDSNGVAMLRQMRRVPELRVLPVAMLGNHTQVQEDAERLGVAVVVTKPVRMDLLADATKTLLGTREVGGDTIRIDGHHQQEEHLDGRVLLVDDNATNRKIAVAMMAKLGIEPDIAENGVEAVEAVKSNAYDVVFMDVQMPVMNGLEATGIIRELATDACNVPIVALTANAMPEDREVCLSAGMDDYLPKPVRGRRLREVLQRWLKEAQQSQADALDPADTLLRIPESGLVQNREGTSAGGMLGLLTEFRKIIDSRVATFVDLHKQSDFRGMGATARRIRGDAQRIGAARLAALGGLLETACLNGDYESADRYARRLPRVSRETNRAIKEFIEQ